MMINVTKEDIESAQVYADLYSELEAYSVDAHKRIVNSFAAHRIATIEVCAKVAEDQQKVFASNEYSIGQPMSSFGERFACGRVAEEIRALKGE